MTDEQIYQKWLALGYLDGLSETDGTVLALLMEDMEGSVSNQPQYQNGITRNTTAGDVFFQVSDIIYKMQRDAFDTYDADASSVFPAQAFFVMVVAACNSQAEGFYGGLSAGLLDPVDHLAFSSKNGVMWALDNVLGGKGKP